MNTLFWVLMIVTCFSAGCAAVGPDYTRPQIRVSGRWNTEFDNGLRLKTRDAGEQEDWWRNLRDPVLSDLIVRGIGGNLDLEKAKSRVREARAGRRIARADLFPEVDAGASFSRSRAGGQTGGADVDLYSVGFDANWELDIFGGVRRSVEAATADAEASREDLRDVMVTLMAEIGINYVEARTYQRRIAVAEEVLGVQRETLNLTQSRFEAGLTGELEVQQARYNLENSRAQIPVLRTGLAEALNRLAVLLGEQPGAVHARMHGEPDDGSLRAMGASRAVTGAIPVAPLDVAVGVPADVLRQRPDVRRAERELAAQTARVGAAVADLYPKFTLSGSIGLDALSAGSLFTGGSRSFGFGPAISFPVFNAGAIRGNIEARSALREQALIAYESSVLSALEEVENALKAYAEEHNRRRSLADAVEAARKASVLAEDRYNAGQSDFSNVLDAQRSLFSFEDQSAQSDGTVASNLIRLYKALGGGWSSLN